MKITHIVLRIAVPVILVSSLFGLNGCLSNKTTLGGGATEVTGSGGRAGTQGQSQQLVKCVRPIGTAALLEPENTNYTHYGLSSPVPMLKLIMTQSGCFQVVSRGATSQALQKERALASGGQLQKNSNMGGGQMVAADYIIEPAIVHKDSNSGGGLGGFGALLPGVVGALASGIKTTNLEAQALLTVTNVRSGVQEAVAEGSAKKRDIGFGGIGFIGAVGGVGGAYEDTDIGKITTAALLDAYNKLVTQLGAIPVDEASSTDNAGYITNSDVNFHSGPSTSAPILMTLPKNTAIIPTGNKNGNWWEVESNGRTGWLHSNYITR